MGTRLEWSTGAAVRRRATEERRYTCPPSLHPGALRIALSAPLCASLFVLSAMILFR